MITVRLAAVQKQVAPQCLVQRTAHLGATYNIVTWWYWHGNPPASAQTTGARKE